MEYFVVECYCTGKFLSEPVILTSTNPQYDKRLYIDLPVQYMKPTSAEHGKSMRITFSCHVLSMFWACSFHVLNLELVSKELNSFSESEQKSSKLTACNSNVSLWFLRVTIIKNPFQGKLFSNEELEILEDDLESQQNTKEKEVHSFFKPRGKMKKKSGVSNSTESVTQPSISKDQQEVLENEQSKN